MNLYMSSVMMMKLLNITVVAYRKYGRIWSSRAPLTLLSSTFSSFRGVRSLHHLA